jgi:hypothetical protein
LLDVSVLIEHFAAATAAHCAGRREAGVMTEALADDNPGEQQRLPSGCRVAPMGPMGALRGLIVPWPQWLRLRGGRWRLRGRDTFAGQDYALRGVFWTEKAAQRAARRRLAELERSQPSATSGGQDGIQDQVYVVRPDGTSYRYRP